MKKITPLKVSRPKGKPSPFNTGVADAVKSIPCSTGQFKDWQAACEYLSGYLQGVESRRKYGLTNEE